MHTHNHMYACTKPYWPVMYTKYSSAATDHRTLTRCSKTPTKTRVQAPCIYICMQRFLGKQEFRHPVYICMQRFLGKQEFRHPVYIYMHAEAHACKGFPRLCFRDATDFLVSDCPYIHAWRMHGCAYIICMHTCWRTCINMPTTPVTKGLAHTYARDMQNGESAHEQNLGLLHRSE